MLRKILSYFFITLSCAFSLEAKIIFIAGASGDIGSALAKHFLEQGHTLICHYGNNKEKLEKIQQKYPQKVFLVQADFNAPETIQGFWLNVLKCRSQIDIVINAAGIEKEDSSLNQIQATMNINYLSPRLICDQAVEYFKAQKLKGIIINIGSRATYRGLPDGYYTYASSKAALTRYSHDIAKHNASTSMMVYVVAPGPVEGSMYAGLRPDVKEQCLASMPTGKVVKIQEVVDMISLLASGKVPSATGGVFDLMGASWTH